MGLPFTWFETFSQAGFAFGFTNRAVQASVERFRSAGTFGDCRNVLFLRLDAIRDGQLRRPSGDAG